MGHSNPASLVAHIPSAPASTNSCNYNYTSTVNIPPTPRISNNEAQHTGGWSRDDIHLLASEAIPEPVSLLTSYSLPASRGWIPSLAPRSPPLRWDCLRESSSPIKQHWIMPMCFVTLRPPCRTPLPTAFVVSFPRSKLVLRQPLQPRKGRRRRLSEDASQWPASHAGSANPR